MALIKSISGIRGTIGGRSGDNLTPTDIVKFTAAFGTLLMQQNPGNKKIIVGRDGRISGAMVKGLVINTLNALVLDVIDLDYSTTPTVEMAVVFEKASGGIILTASHNPKEYNGYKVYWDDGAQVVHPHDTGIVQEANKIICKNVDKYGAFNAPAH